MAFDLPLIVPGIRLDRDAAAESALALRRAKAPWVAGFLLFGGEAEQVASLTADLRAAAGRPIFVASDMERGAGQQVQGLTQLPDLGLLGLAGTSREAFAFGHTTAREALSVGIDVIFAPCLDVRSEPDNPILGNRSLGFDPWRVAELGAGFVAGVRAGGALPVAKHFPGHGATREDSHDALPVVRADARTLEARDLPPFHKALWWAQCPAVMTAHVAYPALDPTGAIATFSAPIVERARAMTHPHVGPDGLLVFTDALLMAGALAGGTEADAALRSLDAGCDMLLYPDGPEAVAQALAASPVDATKQGARLETFLRLGARLAEQAAAEPWKGLEAAPERVARRAVGLALSSGPIDPHGLIVIDDDGIERRGDVLVRAAQAQGVPVVRLSVPGGDRFPGVAPSEGDGTVQDVVVVVFAAARAWKRSAGVSPQGLALAQSVERAVSAAGCMSRTIWCAPRPEDFRDDHLPGTGPHLEQALARHLWPDDDQLARFLTGGVPGDA